MNNNKKNQQLRIHISVTRLNTFISKWSALLYVQNTLHVVMNYQPFLKPRWKWTKYSRMLVVFV